MEKNLKNKYSDSSLLFRLSSHQSQPWAPETKGNIHQELFSPVRSPGNGEEADREAAFCKTWLGLGRGAEGRMEQDSHVARFFAQWRRNESAKDGGPPRIVDHVIIPPGSRLGSWQQLVGPLQCLAADDKVLCCLQHCSTRLVGLEGRSLGFADGWHWDGTRLES